jgi:hypothetical protein
MAEVAAQAKTRADQGVLDAKAAVEAAKAQRAGLPEVTEPVPSAASKQKLPQAELDRRAAERQVDGAERALKTAQEKAQAADQNHQAAQKEAVARRKALAEAEEQAAQKALAKEAEGDAEKPRWSPDKGPFSPKDHRRPDLRDMTEPPAAIDRHPGMRTNPDARVSIYPEALPSRVAAPKGGTPQEVGHDLERALREDLLGGTKYRETHQAGDKTRHGDIGAYEAKAKTELSSEDLDQVWRDLSNPSRGNSAHITVPSLDQKSADALARMAAMFEKLTGIRPTIVVREYAPTPAPGPTATTTTP